MATTPWNEIVTLWSSNGRRRATLQVGPEQFFSSLSLGPDGKRLVSINQDGLICTWDMRAGKRLQTLDPKPGRPFTSALSPDGSLAVTAGKDHVLRLWDVPGKKNVLAMPGHKDAVETVVFSPDMRYLASQEKWRNIHVWDLATGKQLLTLADQNPTFVFAPDGRTLASGGSSAKEGAPLGPAQRQGESPAGPSRRHRVPDLFA